MLSSLFQFGLWSPRTETLYFTPSRDEICLLLWAGQSLGCREWLVAPQTDLQPILKFLCPPSPSLPEAPGAGNYWGLGQNRGFYGELELLLSCAYCQLRLLLSWDSHHLSCFLASKVVLLFPPLQFIWTGSCVFEQFLYCRFSKTWGGRSTECMC